MGASNPFKQSIAVDEAPKQSTSIPKLKNDVKGKSLAELSAMMDGETDPNVIRVIQDQVLLTPVYKGGPSFKHYIDNQAHYYHKFPSAASSWEDMASVAHHKLVEVFKKSWDPNKHNGASLSTFARRSIIRAFEDEIRKSKMLTGISDELFRMYMKAIALGKGSRIDPLVVLTASENEFNDMVKRGLIKSEKIANAFIELRSKFSDPSKKRSMEKLIHSLNDGSVNHLSMDAPLGGDKSLYDDTSDTHGENVGDGSNDFYGVSGTINILIDMIRSKFGKVPIVPGKPGGDYDIKYLEVWKDLDEMGKSNLGNILDDHGVNKYDWDKFITKIKGGWKSLKGSDPWTPGTKPKPKLTESIKSIINESWFIMMVSKL